MTKKLTVDSFTKIAIAQKFITQEQAIAAATKIESIKKLGLTPPRMRDVLVQLKLITEEKAAAVEDIEKKSSHLPSIPGYKLSKPLGRGGMGYVYLATQDELSRTVAIKVLHPEIAADPEYAKRFEREAKAAAKLDHPNITTAYDFGVATQDDGSEITYFTMEFVPGQTIYEMLKKGKEFKERDALKIIREVALALSKAHELGLVHRDLKPDNIILTKGTDGVARVKLLDLGLAKFVHSASELTAEGITAGSPYYIAPEQARGLRDVDTRADIYSLGATLFRMLAGRPPHQGTSAAEVLLQCVGEDAPLLGSIKSDVSKECEALTQMMLRRDIDDRYQSPEDVLADIDLVLARKMPAWKGRESSRSQKKTKDPNLALKDAVSKFDEEDEVPEVSPKSSRLDKDKAKNENEFAPIAASAPTFEAPPTKRSAVHALVPVLMLIFGSALGAFVGPMVIGGGSNEDSGGNPSGGIVKPPEGPTQQEFDALHAQVIALDERNRDLQRDVQFLESTGSAIMSQGSSGQNIGRELARKLDADASALGAHEDGADFQRSLEESLASWISEKRAEIGSIREEVRQHLGRNPPDFTSAHKLLMDRRNEYEGSNLVKGLDDVITLVEENAREYFDRESARILGSAAESEESYQRALQDFEKLKESASIPPLASALRATAERLASVQIQGREQEILMQAREEFYAFLKTAVKPLVDVFDLGGADGEIAKFEESLAGEDEKSTFLRNYAKLVRSAIADVKSLIVAPFMDFLESKKVASVSNAKIEDIVGLNIFGVNTACFIVAVDHGAMKFQYSRADVGTGTMITTDAHFRSLNLVQVIHRIGRDGGSAFERLMQAELEVMQLFFSAAKDRFDMLADYDEIVTRGAHEGRNIRGVAEEYLELLSALADKQKEDNSAEVFARVIELYEVASAGAAGAQNQAFTQKQVEDWTRARDALGSWREQYVSTKYYSEVADKRREITRGIRRAYLRILSQDGTREFYEINENNGVLKFGGDVYTFRDPRSMRDFTIDNENSSIAKNDEASDLVYISGLLSPRGSQAFYWEHDVRGQYDLDVSFILTSGSNAMTQPAPVITIGDEQNGEALAFELGDPARNIPHQLSIYKEGSRTQIACKNETVQFPRDRLITITLKVTAAEIIVLYRAEDVESRGQGRIMSYSSNEETIDDLSEGWWGFYAPTGYHVYFREITPKGTSVNDPLRIRS
ncbi:MAG: serine/threonine protein kinase [Planctomycetes bacterium]|nr:serine/threonine protein kinase [Planctomycetota bacterium]